MKRLIYTLLLALFCLFPLTAMAESDMLVCSEHDSRVVCNLEIGEFISQTRHLLTNGWENTLQIHISLLNAKNSVVMRSRLEATQRCYLDPFDSPCLVLWTGATKWQRYRDEDVFLNAISHFGIQALTLKDLPADNYRVRITVQVMPSASKRLQSISNWFKSSSGDNGASSWSTNSLIGSLLTSQASSIESDVYQKTIETTQFYIDLNPVEDVVIDEDVEFEPDEADDGEVAELPPNDAEAPAEEAVGMPADEPSESAEKAADETSGTPAAE